MARRIVETAIPVVIARVLIIPHINKALQTHARAATREVLAHIQRMQGRGIGVCQLGRAFDVVVGGFRAAGDVRGPGEWWSAVFGAVIVVRF